jgi:hypothetical protein
MIQCDHGIDPDLLKDKKENIFYLSGLNANWQETTQMYKKHKNILSHIDTAPVLLFLITKYSKTFIRIK